MENKESNFVSAIVYVRNDEKTIEAFLDMINKMLSNNFKKYEIICVDDCSSDSSVEMIKKIGSSIKHAVISVVHMSYFQGLEISMNAGIDLSIGDFVFEFDSASFDYKPEVIMQVYNHSMSGFDIVNAAPKKAMRFSSRCFYKIFNKFSNNPNDIQTESFRIISRRGINRVHAMSKTIPYRKAVYVSCGLKIDYIHYETTCKGNMDTNDSLRWNTAIDTLILFTNIGYKISVVLTVIMMIATLCTGGYAIYIFMSASPIAGWTTTMLVMSFSFFGLFAISAIIIKYLSILIDLVFNKMKYVIEGIDKITK